MAATWSAIGLMAAISVAFFYFLYDRLEGLGAKIDEQGRSLGTKIDEQGRSLDAKIDALGAELRADLGGRIDALGARIDALSARLDVHIAGHRSTG